MRPFRFFFGVSLAVILFFFLARFVILALIAASVMSIIFYIGRKVKNFFRNLRWEDDEFYRDEFRSEFEMQPRFATRREKLFYDFPQKRADYLNDFRTIEIR